VYCDGRYYAMRDDGGAGYDDYGSERAYRVEKGRKLLDWLSIHIDKSPRNLLEVGSGFGYTRLAATERGLDTTGVDVSRHAAAGAERLCRLPTFVGTLAEAYDTKHVSNGTFDLVLYQFVLEHLVDPGAELRLAARSLSPDGHVVLIVPSMEAAELAVFGGSYRSARSDHLHLFSRRSLALLLAGAGLALVTAESFCSLHLLRGFLSEQELTVLYASGLGPDLRVIARKEST
jgi:SAM-dependent methyltransferase